jgi:pyridoxal phosphate enzyme (YggS family)
MIPSSKLNNIMEALDSRIQNAAKKSGRSPDDITLIAVTKSFSQNIWDIALQHNLATLAESRIQEAKEKLTTFKHRDKIELHLIGRLQSNKARKACKLFDVIQTVDSVKLAQRLNTVSAEENSVQKIYLQVNIGNDPNKQGFAPEEIIDSAKKITDLKNLELTGIMTIPPNGIPDNNLRALYKKTREIKDKIKESINHHCINLSMGMSDDFEIAVEEGATHIRIGTALFGERPR